MGLNPRLGTFLAAASGEADSLINLPDLTASREALRRELAALDAEKPDIWRTTDIAPGRVAEAIPIRIYEPVPGDRRPALVFLHGGGYVRGSIETHDSICRLLATNSGAVVFSVGYRLSPEVRFPVPLEDCHAATCGIVSRATEFGIDRERIAIGGDSAGGNLCAGVIRLANARCGPCFRHQLLLYPNVDMQADTESFRLYSKGFFLDLMPFYVASYTRDETDFDNPLCSPLRADDFSDQPPATIMVCGFDPLRDEGVAYAAKLEAAGVHVELVEHRDMVHGFLLLRGVVKQEADAALAECGRAVARALAPHERRLEPPAG